MSSGLPLKVEDTDQVVPPTSRKVYIAVDENGLRIGETHHRARLTDQEVDQIRDLREIEKWSLDRLAVKFNCPKATIQSICEYRRRASTIAGWKVLLLHSTRQLTQPKEEQHHERTLAHHPA